MSDFLGLCLENKCYDSRVNIYRVLTLKKLGEETIGYKFLTIISNFHPNYGCISSIYIYNYQNTLRPKLHECFDWNTNMKEFMRNL
jgi:hypothetical protein